MSATAIFDLERAGFSREQVEALARWQERGLDVSHLATKADLAAAVGGLELKIAETRGDLRREVAETKAELIKWVVGVGFAQVVVLIGAVVALIRLFPGAHP